MQIRILAFFAANYAQDSLQVRKKSRILAAIALAFGLISILFASLMAATGAIVAAAERTGKLDAHVAMRLKALADAQLMALDRNVEEARAG